jgi:hypothetical protein
MNQVLLFQQVLFIIFKVISSFKADYLPEDIKKPVTNERHWLLMV